MLRLVFRLGARDMLAVSVSVSVRQWCPTKEYFWAKILFPFSEGPQNSWYVIILQMGAKFFGPARVNFNTNRSFVVAHSNSFTILSSVNLFRNFDFTVFDIEKNRLVFINWVVVTTMRIAICFRLLNFFHQHILCEIEAHSFSEIDVLARCSLGDLSTKVKKKVHLLSKSQMGTEKY